MADVPDAAQRQMEEMADVPDAAQREMEKMADVPDAAQGEMEEMADVPDAAQKEMEEMAEVGFLLENLKELVTQNADLIAGAEENAKGLCQELEELQGQFPKKCKEECSDNDALDKLSKDVRKMVHKAEDAIENYIVTASKQKSRSTFKGALFRIEHPRELRNSSKELETIKQEVQKLKGTKICPGLQAKQVDKGREQRVKKPKAIFIRRRREHLSCQQPPVDDDMLGSKEALNEKVMNQQPPVDDDMVVLKDALKEDVMNQQPKLSKKKKKQQPPVDDNMVGFKETLKEKVMCQRPPVDDNMVGFRKTLKENVMGQRPLVDDDMVGFKDAMEDVMKILKEGPEAVQTVSILGMPGLGKTTLARNIFKDPIVENYFFFRAFVKVSAECKTKEVFLKILRDIGNGSEEMNRKSEDELAQAIKNYLGRRNFLIVLDDVRTKETWDNLKGAFPTNQKRSRILITTPQKDVAEYAGQGFQFEPYNLRILTNEESRGLLRKRVFGKKDKILSGLQEHESRILDMCNGLPLAIVVVAGILTDHQEESHWWKRVADNVQKCSTARTQQAKNVTQLSFSNLPYHLKPCFLYLGVFPEGFEIPSKTLVQLWASEGFVPPPPNRDQISEDIAEGYLKELADRNLVMVEKRRLNGGIKTIHIHDTLHEFCKAKAVEEKVFREIKEHEQGGNISPDDDRRLCINSKVQEYIKSKISGRSVRSFLSFAKEDFTMPIEHISDIPRAFKLLRVLDIRSIKLTRFPAELYDTLLLKYIAMSTDLKIIPQKLSNLRSLQTLIFKTTQRCLEIRADIWKMTQLRHLETNASTSLQTTEEALSVNANLQTLCAISPESCRSEVFGRAPQLKKLGICGTLSSGQDHWFDALSRLDFLENLKLLNDNATEKLRSLPSENSFPTKLTRLTLQNTMLDWGHMSTLGKLEKLQVLKLKNYAFLGAYWDTKSDGFRALEVLHVDRTDLITWKASASHFPKLTHLYLKHCPKLEAIPSDFVNISTLQLIDIYCCNGLVAHQLAKLKVQAQDKDDRRTILKLSVYLPDQ